MAEDPLDAIAFTVEALVVADRNLAVRFGWNDRLDAAPFQIVADGVAVVGFIGDEGLRLLPGQIDQRGVSLAVRSLARREMEGDGPASGIAETINLTG